MSEKNMYTIEKHMKTGKEIFGVFIEKYLEESKDKYYLFFRSSFEPNQLHIFFDSSSI